MKNIANRDGFTLIEIIIVMIIVGVLAAIALPNLFNNVQTGQGSGALQAADALKSPLETCLARFSGATPGTGNCGFTGGTSELSLSNALNSTAVNAGSGADVVMTASAGTASAGNASYTLSGISSAGNSMFTLQRSSAGIITCTPGASPYNNIC